MDLKNTIASHSVESGPPAADTLVHNSREESGMMDSNDDINDSIGLNSQERPTLDKVTVNSRKRTLLVGTWNVRTLYQPGKTGQPCSRS